jgi:hypothetical protein
VTHIAPAISSSLGVAPQFAYQFSSDPLDLPLPLPDVTRRGVHLAKAVQNRAANAVLGVGSEVDAFSGIVLPCRVDEPERSGLNQVVELDMGREVLPDCARDDLDERHVICDEFLRLRRSAPARGHTIGMHVQLLVLGLKPGG